ncbi:MAG: 50S ribosomal protein L15 [Desulfobacteraceae bacterium]|jgi:large subunit ribosomal protein L15|nr:50S ribosomal protein L15 [Desulfobacteraceae bacterium]
MKLNELSPAEGSRSSRKRLGRGVGSGWGKTAGRGSKGHRSRSGGGTRPGFEGGQMPLHRRLPKRGFANIFKKKIIILNIADLKRFESGAIVDEATLLSVGMAKGVYDAIKLLGNGDIDFPITVKVNAASKSAIDKIEAAGGKVEVVS